ncbi:MAG: hypothetical protein HY028_11875 [Gammaproteobacteria bacterium]|nr:hypothetical protein [Gammaproteobacteria bacterium]
MTLLRSVWREWWISAPLLLAISAVFLLTAVLQLIAWRAPPHPPALQQWTGVELNLVEGKGHKGQDTLAVEALSDKGVAIASASSIQIEATDYSTVRLEIGGTPPSSGLFVLWRRADNPGEIFTLPLNKDDQQTLSLRVSDDAAWRGKLSEIGLAITAPLTGPLVIHRLTLIPVNAQPTLSDLVAEWLTHEPWSAASINFLYGGTPYPTLPLLVTAVAIVVIACGLYFVLVWLRVMAFNPLVVPTLFFSAWLLLDLRWQFNLLNELSATSHNYAGKTWAERHKSAEDDDLFVFVMKVKENLPTAPVRILFFSDLDYLRGRGAYYLYPHNVYKSAGFPSIQNFRSGEYIAFYQKAELQYNPTAQKLLLGNNQEIPVDLILWGNGYGLLKVR